MSAHNLFVDLRSDTVTRPTAAMRQAMADAVVGDDVLGDDPTVQDLERRLAALTGKESALFVPSGTMGNQIAIHVQVSPGDQVLLEADSHVFHYEQGGVAANSGALVRLVPTDRGAILPAQLEAAQGDETDDHIARLRLVCLENTHNRHGGAIVPLDRLRAIAAAAHERNIGVHLDGARLWNASVATGIPIHDWAAHVDTMMMCFSKGLGAPIGSILVGPAALLHEARRVRKRWGGGMRQVGILAAACLHAVEHHLDRLADDHRRARLLAEGIASTPGVRVLEPETNIVMITLDHPALDPVALESALAEQGVLVLAFGGRRVRAMTHLDVDDAGVERAIEVFRQVVARQVPATVGGRN